MSNEPMFEEVGTCCPTCGERQSHIHLGWLSISKGVVFTQVICKKCKQNSLIVRFKHRPVGSELLKAYDQGIRNIQLSEKEVSQ